MAETEPSNFKRDMDFGKNRVEPRIFGVGRFGVSRFSPSDPTRFAWTRTKPILGLLLILGGLALWARADSFTPGLTLQKPSVDVEDPNEPWGVKTNRNLDTLDAAICDKRVGCTFAGPIIVSTITAPAVVTSTLTVLSSATFTTDILINGLRIQGAKTLAQIRLLVCPEGAGKCLVIPIDEKGTVYLSSGSAPGQYQNTKGVGP